MFHIIALRTWIILFLFLCFFSKGNATISCVTTTVTIRGVNYDFTPDYNVYAAVRAIDFLLIIWLEDILQ